MQGYDAALELLLLAPASSVLKQVTGLTVTQWLNVEMRQISFSRADLVGETSDGGILHVELQSTNDSDMALRMAEYALNMYRQYRKLPRQMVLYVGEAPLRMTRGFSGPDSSRPDFSYNYRLVDIRELDGAELLASSHVPDNVLAILARLQDRLAAIPEILQRIASLEESERTAGATSF